MKNFCFLLILVFFGCENERSKNPIPVTILNSSIEINYYEDDSLNRARRYVLPVMSFEFVAINSSDSLFNLVVNAFTEEEPSMLFVTFFREEGKDTLILSDFESFRINKIKPHDTTRFIIKGFIPEILPENHEKEYSAKELMKAIAESGEIYYIPVPFDQSLLEEGYLLKDTIHLKRSKDFEIIYKDPDIISVE